MTSRRRGARASVRTALALSALRSSLLLTVALLAVHAALPAQAAPDLKTDDEQAVYFIGVLMGRQLEMLNLSDSEAKLVLQGVKDERKGDVQEFDPKVIGPKLQAFQQTRAGQALEVETKNSALFVEAQSKKPGAKVTEAGTIYIEIKEGDGAQPTISDKVRVNYEGKLRDGTIFDSGSAEFPLEGVIKCWGDGVSKMKVGGKAKLVCPADIAYGERGVPPAIPPGAALAFEVELLEITTEK
jgi:FKBP-type peptidyl-prolyl cis-trans isomerase FkpA